MFRLVQNSFKVDVDNRQEDTEWMIQKSSHHRFVQGAGWRVDFRQQLIDHQNRNHSPMCSVDYHNRFAPSLKIISLNCRSVRSSSKRNQLAALITEHNVDIIIGCESHLDSSIPSSEILPPHYRIYRKDRSLGGGGVFIGIRNHINASEESFIYMFLLQTT